MKILIVHNQSAGYGDGAVYDFLRALAKPGVDITLRPFTKDEPVPGKLADVESFDAVVASGGDGTIARVCYEMRDSKVPIMPFPAGTSNALAINLLSPAEPHALAQQLLAMKTLDFDMGEIRFGGEAHGFSLVAGCGYDATIMDAAAENKQLLGPMAYFQAAFTNLNPQRSHFRIRVDGVEHEFDGLSVMLANFSRMQFDIALTHENLPNDGLLDIVVLKGDNAIGLLQPFITTLLDRNGGFPDRGESVELLRGQEVEVIAEPELSIQFDGESSGATTPFSARVLPGCSRFIVSEACVERYS